MAGQVAIQAGRDDEAPPASTVRHDSRRRSGGLMTRIFLAPFAVHLIMQRGCLKMGLYAYRLPHEILYKMLSMPL
ncbi:MAG TPA: hypothetical protein VGC09_11360, partial [Rhodopila sp.]